MPAPSLRTDHTISDQAESDMPPLRDLLWGHSIASAGKWSLDCDEETNKVTERHSYRYENLVVLITKQVLPLRSMRKQNPRPEHVYWTFSVSS